VLEGLVRGVVETPGPQLPLTPSNVCVCFTTPPHRSLVLQMAELAVGKNLREWIEANTTFPNSMVDRITPATEDVHREILQQVRPTNLPLNLVAPTRVNP
jgi:hypothetical protein